MSNEVVVMHYAGSTAYGTNLPTSDEDIRGIFCQDRDTFSNPFITTPGHIDLEDCEDGVLYELGKYLTMLSEANPNIIETVWVDDKFIIESSPAYELLRSKRDLFLTSKVAFTFGAYAVNQINHMKSRSKWLNNPQPEEAPKRRDYVRILHGYSGDISEINEGHTLVYYGGYSYGIAESEGSTLFTPEGELRINKDATVKPSILVSLDTQGYMNDKKNHKEYWNWVQNRNEVRSETEREFGYDTKNAMHVVRLLRMAEEALSTGEVNILRPDAEELLAIRRGSMTYEELLEYSRHMDDRIKTLTKTTCLPIKVDYAILAPLWKELTDIIWSN